MVSNSAKSKYIEVPSIELIVPKKITLFKSNFYEAQEELHSKNNKMLTPYEFKEFLKVTKKEDMNLYNEITGRRPPSHVNSWRTEWLDAEFETKNGEICIIYHIFDSNGKIIQKTEKLDKSTLIDNRPCRISIDSWLEDSTSQGLPKKSALYGLFNYVSPKKNYNSFVNFYAIGDSIGLATREYLSDTIPSPDIGGRAARRG